jgi:ribonuclease HII
MDEANTESVIGPVVVVGVLLPAAIAPDIQEVVATAATKMKSGKKFPYWDRLVVRLNHFADSGLRIQIESIPPAIWDGDSGHSLRRASYQKIIDDVLRDAPVSSCQVVLDRFEAESPLDLVLAELSDRGAETVHEYKADNHYLAARAASVFARHERLRLYEELLKDPRFKVEGVPIPLGTSGTDAAKAWLAAWKSSGRPWPWFVKKSARQ